MVLEIQNIAKLFSDCGFVCNRESIPRIKQQLLHDEELKYHLLRWWMSVVGFTTPDSGDCVDIATILEETGAFRSYNPRKILTESPNEGEEEMYLHFWKTLGLLLRGSVDQPRYLSDTVYNHTWKQQQGQNTTAPSLIPNDIQQELAKRKTYQRQSTIEALEKLAEEQPGPSVVTTDEPQQSLLDLQSRLVAVSSLLEKLELPVGKSSAVTVQLGKAGEEIGRFHQGIHSSKSASSNLSLLKQDASHLV